MRPEDIIATESGNQNSLFGDDRDNQLNKFCREISDNSSRIKVITTKNVIFLQATIAH
jgi:hypothetical protein